MEWKTILKISVSLGIAGVLLFLLLVFLHISIFNPEKTMMSGIVAMFISVIIVSITTGILTYRNTQKSKVQNTIISILIAILITIFPVLIGTLIFG